MWKNYFDRSKIKNNIFFKNAQTIKYKKGLKNKDKKGKEKGKKKRELSENDCHVAAL